MIIIGRRTLSVILVILFFFIGFISVRYLNRPRIRLGDHYLTINYRAKINSKKTYHLKLWDYKWPGAEDDTWYQPIIERVIKDFEKENPNIRVELSLLDFKEGPKEFSKALASGAAPDVYCSAYDIPEFNYQWQIPAGIFLKPQELNEYYPKLRKLLTLENYLLTLPRWSVPGVWIGNRALMEKAGLSVEKIQKQGWSWQDLIEIKERTKPICIGNFSATGLFSQILAVDGSNQTHSDISRVLDIFNLINGPLPQQSDYETNMFQLFLSGKVMFLGGVRPIIYDFIKQKATTTGVRWEPTLLPIPCDKPGKIILPVESGVIGIYRSKKSRGDDQLAAATRLAYYISVNRQTVPWERLKVVPAAPVIARKWAKSLANGCSGQLVNWFAEGDFVNIKVSPGYQEEIYPGIKGFLSGKTSYQELESIIMKNYYPVEKH